MSIRRRGDKWLVTVELGRDGTGKRRRHCSTCASGRCSVSRRRTRRLSVLRSAVIRSCTMADLTRTTPGSCLICGARLAPDNTSGACASHPRYDPRTDPEFESWLLCVLRRRRGRLVQPLLELRRAGKVCPPSRDARDAVHDRIETLRRNGHHIRGRVGQSGGYVYVRGPNDARVPRSGHERQ